MPAGLTVYNDAGYIQIDETYKNLALVQKATVATTTSLASASSAASQVTLTFTNRSKPILFFRGSVKIANMAMAVSGTTYTYYVQVAGAVGTTFDYYLFDEPVLQNLKVGLEVYNSAGQLTFESGQKYIRVVDFIKNVAATSGTSTTDYTYTAGRTYAFGFASMGYLSLYITPGPGGLPAGSVNNYLVGGLSITDGVRIGSFNTYRQTYTGSGVTYAVNANILIIDVTSF